MFQSIAFKTLLNSPPVVSQYVTLHLTAATYFLQENFQKHGGKSGYKIQKLMQNMRSTSYTLFMKVFVDHEHVPV